jgi:hypothetical protein
MSSRELYSAAYLLESADKERLIRKKRPSSLRLVLKDYSVILRDQEPLQAGNIEFQHGWTLAELVELLNKQVFFWPGDACGPSKYGIRHYNRYQKLGEGLGMLRVKTADLMESNRDSPPKFCRYNSGSPRCSGGQRSPRGDDTFLHYEDFNGTPSDVVEVVFHRRVQLPNSVGYGILTGDLWQSAE